MPEPASKKRPSRRLRRKREVGFGCVVTKRRCTSRSRPARAEVHSRWRCPSCRVPCVWWSPCPASRPPRDAAVASVAPATAGVLRSWSSAHRAAARRNRAKRHRPANRPAGPHRAARRVAGRCRHRSPSPPASPARSA